MMPVDTVHIVIDPEGNVESVWTETPPSEAVPDPDWSVIKMLLLETEDE